MLLAVRLNRTAFFIVQTMLMTLKGARDTVQTMLMTLKDARENLGVIDMSENVEKNIEEVENTQQTSDENNETNTENEQKEKTFTESQLQSILNDRLERERKTAYEKGVSEGEKLSQMNDRERKDHEYEQMQQRIQELEDERNFNTLSNEATKMITDEGLKVSDELLSTLVTKDAETTRKNVTNYITAVNTEVERQVKEISKQSVPKASGNTRGGMTMEEILKLPPEQQTQAVIANRHFLNK